MNLKTPQEIDKIAESGKILARVMRDVVLKAKEGVLLSELDRLTERLILKAGARPAFLNYKPDGATHSYQASICASVNEVIVHGFPTHYKLKSGDVLKLDFGVNYRGFYSDAASTVLIGKTSAIAKELAKSAKEALNIAIKKARPGKTLGDIGFEIEKCAKKYGFKPVRGLTGHGIGFKLHEGPIVHNYGEKGRGLKLLSGMVLAIEPMFSAGSDEVIQLPDESWATKDKSLTAHFEHTIAITNKGARVLTKI
ncbi:type I methionyl aminopeptidase [Candidatus Wolfebacteria bacterium]|nr:type I methionyl aminopeptidase [Candidatus Wolfebacteria bacterium]